MRCRAAGDADRNGALESRWDERVDDEHTDNGDYWQGSRIEKRWSGGGAAMFVGQFWADTSV